MYGTKRILASSWRGYEHFMIHERSLYSERLQTNVEALWDLPNLRLANTYGKYYEALCSELQNLQTDASTSNANELV
jgi:hypothetical protein